MRHRCLDEPGHPRETYVDGSGGQTGRTRTRPEPLQQGAAASGTVDSKLPDGTTFGGTPRPLRSGRSPRRLDCDGWYTNSNPGPYVGPLRTTVVRNAAAHVDTGHEHGAQPDDEQQPPERCSTPDALDVVQLPGGSGALAVRLSPAPPTATRPVGCGVHPGSDRRAHLECDDEDAHGERHDLHRRQRQDRQQRAQQVQRSRDDLRLRDPRMDGKTLRRRLGECNVAGWDPNAEMLMFVVGGTAPVSRRRRSGRSRASAPTSSQLSPRPGGAVYATNAVNFGNNARRTGRSWPARVFSTTSRATYFPTHPDRPGRHAREPRGLRPAYNLPSFTRASADLTPRRV